MKKFAVVLMTLVMVLVCAIAYANEDPIWSDVYDVWKEKNKDIYEVFLNTEYSYTDGFERNNMLYMASYNMTLTESINTMSVKEMEKEIKRQYDLHCDTDSTVTINVIGYNHYFGRNVMEIQINVDKDLRTIDELNLDKTIYTEPVMGMYIICYDKY